MYTTDVMKYTIHLLEDLESLIKLIYSERF